MRATVFAQRKSQQVTVHKRIVDTSEERYFVLVSCHVTGHSLHGAQSEVSKHFLGCESLAEVVSVHLVIVGATCAVLLTSHHVEVVNLVDLCVVGECEALANGARVRLLPVSQWITTNVRRLCSGGTVPVLHFVKAVGIATFQMGFQTFDGGCPVKRGIEHKSAVVATTPVLFRLLCQRHVGALPFHDFVVRHGREVRRNHARETLCGNTVESLLRTYLVCSTLRTLSVCGLVVHTGGHRELQFVADIVIQLE